MVFPNKSKINHKWVSLDWQRRASRLFLHQTVLNRVNARESRKERKRSEETVKYNNITNQFRASSAGQFHLYATVVVSLLFQLGIKLLAPVSVSVSPHYNHQPEY